MQKKMKRSLLLILGILTIIPATGWADFNMTDPSVTGSGSGDSVGTGIITDTGTWTGDDGIPEPGFASDGFNYDRQDVTPTGSGIIFQDAFAGAADGTAAASTGGAFSNTQAGVNAGDTVTVQTSGTTSVTARRQNDETADTEENVAEARLIAAGGAGAVANNLLLADTQTGFMLALADTYTESYGSDDNSATEAVDTEAKVSGSASVNYRFAGQTGPETVSVSNAASTSTSDVDDEAQDSSTAESLGWVLGMVGWTDTDTAGQTFGSQAGISSQAWADNEDEEGEGAVETDVKAAGTVGVDFIYRPIANPVFSFLGSANGSTDANAVIHEDDEGEVWAQGSKVAIGSSGTGAEASPLAAAWLVASVWMRDYEDWLDASARGHVVNPAVLGKSDVDPDPSMIVGTQYGTFSCGYRLVFA